MNASHTQTTTQQSVLVGKTSAEWEAFLAPRDVMCEPVRAPEGVLQSEPQVCDTHLLFKL